MIVSLIGYRATGKTTVARLLAEALNCRWIDSDREIERQAGKTIAEIFAEDGEPAFRNFEERIISELCLQEDLILATGGGAIMRENTRKILRQSGPVLWLTASAETILQRMSGDETTLTSRPSLTNLPPLEEIKRLLEVREPFYRDCATMEITTEICSPEEIVQQLLSVMKQS
ncbi:MAG: shikimate kinase [Planctomycetaceae bacterium]|nr:shikimate kinase [Planctomycetaceae bacterium]MBQ2821248.1 shikimate kinase [Thermoguttaceae bacterium]